VSARFECGGRSSRRHGVRQNCPTVGVAAAAAFNCFVADQADRPTSERYLRKKTFDRKKNFLKILADFAQERASFCLLFYIEQMGETGFFCVAF
jgi:hypothetical protein